MNIQRAEETYRKLSENEEFTDNGETSLDTKDNIYMILNTGKSQHTGMNTPHTLMHTHTHTHTHTL